MKISAIQLSKGNIIEHEGKLWQILDRTIMQPGKGAAVVQVSMRDVRSGLKSDVRFRTQETVEQVRLDEEEFTFLFGNGDDLTFMNKETFEQISVTRDLVGDSAAYLTEGMEVSITSFEGAPLSVELPDTVTLEIVEAEPVIKGQTATTSYKPAILSNGVKVMVPPHIGAGTRIVVKTIDSSYVERAKD